MKLRQHASSIAAVIGAVAVGVWFFLDSGKVSDRERKEREHDVFPAYRRADIDAIEIDLAQPRENVRIERRPDPGDAGDTHWELVSPVEERADPAAVDAFVGDLEFAGVIRRVDPAASPDIARGFEAPRVRGTLSMKPLVYHFTLGGPAPAPEGSAYLRVDGEGVFVVSKDFVASLLKGSERYRDRTVIPYLSLDLAGLRIRSPHGSLGVSRVDEVAFRAEATGLRVSRDGMDKVWGALAEARASSFLTDAEAERALAGAEGVFEVVMIPKDDQRPKGELRIGGTCPGHPDDVVLLRAAPTRAAACVPRGVVEGLATPESELIDRRLFTARADEVEEITFERLAGPAQAPLVVELARKGKGWHERRPNDRTLEGTEIDAANDLVTRLTRAEGDGVKKGTAPFTATARVRVRRGGSGTEETVEIEQGARPGEVRVRRLADGAELRVDADLAARLLASEIALRGRSVFPDALGRREISALTVACGEVHESLVRTGDAWSMRDPRGFAVDALAVADALALFRNAQAETWIADTEPEGPAFGLRASRCRVDVVARGDGGTTEQGIVFGRDAEAGGVYARRGSESAVFLAPRALRDGLVGWLVDRGAFHAERAAVERVTLSRGGRSAIFVNARVGRDGGPHDTAEAVLDTLDGLRGDEVIRLGPARREEGFSPPTLDVRVTFKAAPRGVRRPDLHFTLGDTRMAGRSREVLARVDGVDATFGIARERVVSLIDAL